MLRVRRAWVSNGKEGQEERPQGRSPNEVPRLVRPVDRIGEPLGDIGLVQVAQDEAAILQRACGNVNKRLGDGDGRVGPRLAT